MIIYSAQECVIWAEISGDTSSLLETSSAGVAVNTTDWGLASHI